MGPSRLSGPRDLGVDPPELIGPTRSVALHHNDRKDSLARKLTNSPGTTAGASWESLLPIHKLLGGQPGQCLTYCWLWVARAGAPAK